ncbi:MAG: selenium cofactor biosynthesis protein YqeC [Lachnospiraceae bacterium]|nr:selenium cofactor biosynthesis protein YqeC [Lachnospiraceae bacterium]
MRLTELLDIDVNSKKIISVVGGGGKTSLIFRLAEELAEQGKKVIVTTTTHMAFEPERPFARAGELNKVRENLRKYGYTVAACMENREEKSWKKPENIQGSSGTHCSAFEEQNKNGKLFTGKLQALPEEQLQELKKECDIILIEADGAKRLPLKVPAAWEPVIPEMTDLVIGVIGLDCLGKPVKDTAHRPESAAEFLGKSTEEKITEEDIIRIAESAQGLRKSVGHRGFRVFLNKEDVLSDRNLPDKIVQRLKQRRIRAAYGSLRQNISIVVLAAGNSRRFGSNKLLFPIDGIPMYLNTLQKVLQVQRKMKHRISSVILVTQYPEIKKNAEALGTRAVWNPHPEQGISSSMKLGLLEAIKENPHAPGLSACGEKDACLFLVADQPWIRTETIEALIQTFVNSERGMAAAAKNGQPGNPCIFSGKYYPELLALTGDTGGKKVMKRYPEDVALLEVEDKKELVDMDTPMDIS